MNLRDCDQTLARIWLGIEASITSIQRQLTPAIVAPLHPKQPTMVERIAALSVGEALTVYCVGKPDGFISRAKFKAEGSWRAERKPNKRLAWIVERTA